MHSSVTHSPAQRWRRARGIPDPAGLRDALHCGSLYWWGYDADGRPILWVRPAVKDWSRLNVRCGCHIAGATHQRPVAHGPVATHARASHSAEVDMHVLLVETGVHLYVPIARRNRSRSPAPAAADVDACPVLPQHAARRVPVHHRRADARHHRADDLACVDETARKLTVHGTLSDASAAPCERAPDALPLAFALDATGLSGPPCARRCCAHALVDALVASDAATLSSGTRRGQGACSEGACASLTSHPPLERGDVR